MSKNTVFTESQMFAFSLDMFDWKSHNLIYFYIFQYSGMGIDIRRRGIWDMYGDGTQLIEQSITPSDDSLFPQYDWIIGRV